MVDIQRVKKVIKWLIYQGVAENESDLSTKMGYTKSSFSQIINGRVNVSDKFIDKLCCWDDNINKVWIKRGEGLIFINKDSIGTSEVINEKQIETKETENLNTVEKGVEINLMNLLLNEKERVIQEKDKVIEEKERLIRERERIIKLIVSNEISSSDLVRYIDILDLETREVKKPEKAFENSEQWFC